MIDNLKKLTAMLLWACVFYSNDAFAQLEEQVNRFLVQHVHNGLVHYAAIKNNTALLDSIVLTMSELHTEKLPDIEAKTFWINAYNIFVIKSVVEQYPISSPNNIKGFFDVKKHRIGRLSITLNQLENDLLRKKFPDARLHFALVCAAVDCPPLFNEAYTPEQLPEQLTRQTQKALNNDSFIRVDTVNKKVGISEIFSWYETDFKQEAPTFLSYINKYRNVQIPSDYSVYFYPYNWAINEYSEIQLQTEINIQNYTPSVLLRKGQLEYKLFNNLYTQTNTFNVTGEREKNNFRATYFTGINQFLFGISNKLNIGFDIWFKAARIHDVKSNPAEILQLENSTNSRFLISGIGPKIKISPFKKIRGFTMQSTFLLPTGKDMEGRNTSFPYVSADSYLLITQLFYDKPIGNSFQLFSQFSPWLYLSSIPRPDGISPFNYSNPASIFFSYFPTQRITLYTQHEWWPSFSTNGVSSWFLQQGMGAKYQIIKGFLEAEIVYTAFTLGKNSGAGQTFNAGIRFIR